MIYLYTCRETEESIEREFSMQGDIPSSIEENGKVYHRDYRGSVVHIPFQWGKESGIRFDKSPSRRKHFY